MAKKLSSVLGIDIGSRKIKIAEVKGGKEPTISALGMIDTPEGAVDHTGVYNSEAVGAALKQLIGQSGVSVSHVVVSIAGQASVLVRTLEVPRMNATELAEHMQWEINRNIPFAESNVFSDFKPLEDEDPSSPNMDVVMAIAPQSAIDALLTAIKKAGKQIAAIDVQPLGLARSLRTSYEEEYRDMTICAVDVGHKTTSINIYKDGKLLMPRQVPVGGEMFTKAISDALGIGMEEAELLKQQKCFVSSGLLQSSVDDAFGFGLPPAAAPGQTQEFTPYNPFADDNVPMAPPSPSHSLPQPPPLDLAATPAEYDPEMVAPFDSTPFSTNPTFGEPEQEPLAPPHASHDPYANHGDDTLLPPPPAAEHPLEPAPAIPVPVGVDPETEKTNTAIAPVLDEFVAEVRRSLDYFKSRGGAVDRIVLCGGASKLRGLSDLLASALATPCDSYDPLKRLNVGGKRIEPQFVDDHRPDFAIAVGNGLHIFFE